jgi:hypothetical protein
VAGTRDPDAGPGETNDGEIQEDEILDAEDGEGGELDEGDAADGGEGEPVHEEEGQARDVGRQGRPTRDTFKILRSRAQEAERALTAERSEREALNRRLADLEIRQRQPDPAQLAREQAEEEARVEMMTPAQVARYYAEKTRRDVAQVISGQSFTIQDRIDKQTFDADVRNNPLLARVAPRVEQVLAEERRAGRNTDRLIVAKYLLGDEMMTRHQTGAPRQRKAAAGRVNGQGGRPVNGAGDAQRQGGRQSDDSYEAAVRRSRGVIL